jgi:hypothetical protein
LNNTPNKNGEMSRKYGNTIGTAPWLFEKKASGSDESEGRH